MKRHLQQVNSETSSTSEFLPLLADVPEPVGIDYDTYVTNSDDDYVEYFYTMTDSQFTAYDKLLILMGWKEFKTGYDDEDNPISYYSKGDNTIGIG